MFVTRNMTHRMMLRDDRAKASQCVVLRVFEISTLKPFELDAD